MKRFTLRFVELEPKNGSVHCAGEEDSRGPKEHRDRPWKLTELFNLIATLFWTLGVAYPDRRGL
jgi:hypothetical protein